jgi:GTP-binding protein HflX
MIETSAKKEKAIIVAVGQKTDPTERIEEFIDELAFLTETLNIQVVGKFHQRLEYPDPRTFVGKGKLDEIKTFATIENVNCVVFDDNLSPSQLRNLEKELKIRVYDRSLLIRFDFFFSGPAPGSCSTTLSLKVRPHSGQSRKQVLVSCQLNLRFSLRGFRSFQKYIQDE